MIPHVVRPSLCHYSAVKEWPDTPRVNRINDSRVARLALGMPTPRLNKYHLHRASCCYVSSPDRRASARVWNKVGFQHLIDQFPIVVCATCRAWMEKNREA